MNIVISIASVAQHVFLCAAWLRGDVSHAYAALPTTLRCLAAFRLTTQGAWPRILAWQGHRDALPSRCSALVMFMCSPTAYMRSVYTSLTLVCICHVGVSVLAGHPPAAETAPCATTAGNS